MYWKESITITEAEEQINELEDKMVEITAEEQNKEKRMKRVEDNLRDLWDNTKCTNIRIIGGPRKRRKKRVWVFPGGAVVESPPANAGDAGSSPGLGRSHMPWSNWACEPQLLSLCVWSLCSATGEATIVRGLRTAMKSGSRLPQLEKALTQKTKPQHSQK